MNILKMYSLMYSAVNALKPTSTPRSRYMLGVNEIVIKIKVGVLQYIEKTKDYKITQNLGLRILRRGDNAASL